MVNFVTIIPQLAGDVEKMVKKIGFQPSISVMRKNEKIRNNKYTIRISQNADKFIERIDLHKR